VATRAPRLLQQQTDIFLFFGREHVVSDATWRKQNGFGDRFQELKPAAITELEKLSTHVAWWVRLYVAETYWRHAELRERRLSSASEKIRTNWSGKSWRESR
jgi:hypothetical protein